MKKDHVEHNNYQRTSMRWFFTLAAAPRLNTAAAKRFVRSALWEAEEQQGEGEEAPRGAGRGQATEDVDTCSGSYSGAGGCRKRKLDNEEPNSNTAKRTRL